MSRFDKAVDATTKMMLETGESRNRKKKRKWSTSNAKDYNELLTTFDSTGQNTDYVKLYNKDKAAKDGAPASIQAALKSQIQFLAAIRRAIRMKMVVGASAREFSSLDHDRYAYTNGAVGLKKMYGIQNSPETNPSDGAISSAAS